MPSSVSTSAAHNRSVPKLRDSSHDCASVDGASVVLASTIDWVVHAVAPSRKYELSSDIEQKQLQVIEKKYGGRVRAHRAAIIIQRAFRRHTLANNFRKLLKRQHLLVPRSCDNSARMPLVDPYGSVVAPKLRLKTYGLGIRSSLATNSSCVPLTKQLELDRKFKQAGDCSTLLYNTAPPTSSSVSKRTVITVKIDADGRQLDEAETVCSTSQIDLSKIRSSRCCCPSTIDKCEETAKRQISAASTRTDCSKISISGCSFSKRRSMSMENGRKPLHQRVEAMPKAMMINNHKQQPGLVACAANDCQLPRLPIETAALNSKTAAAVEIINGASGLTSHFQILSDKHDILRQFDDSTTINNKFTAIFQQTAGYELTRCSSMQTDNQGGMATHADSHGHQRSLIDFQIKHCPVVRAKSSSKDADLNPCGAARVKCRGSHGRPTKTKSITDTSTSEQNVSKSVTPLGTPSSDDSGVCSSSSIASSSDATKTAAPAVGITNEVWVPRDLEFLAHCQKPECCLRSATPSTSWHRRSLLLNNGARHSELQRKRQYRIALNFFNKKPERGMQFLIKWNYVEHSPDAVAKFLLTRKGLSKQMIGEYLGNLQNSFNMAVLDSFVSEIDIKAMEIDIALRHFQSFFRLPGEAQKIERIIEVFARRYQECNRKTTKKIFRHQDTVFILAFAIIMLNTDLHSPNIKPDKRMKVEDFVKNLRGIDGNHDIDPVYLTDLYCRIKNQELKSGVDHVTQVLKVERSIVGQKPTLAVNHRRLVCYCRLFEVHDVQKKQSLDAHQREVFLFNDMLLITKLNAKRKAAATYAFRQIHRLAGLQVESVKNYHYPFGLKISFTMNKNVLYFNARNEEDREKFIEDLKEAVMECDEMEALRIELELEKQQNATGGFSSRASYRCHSLGRAGDKPQRDSGVSSDISDHRPIASAKSPVRASKDVRPAATSSKASTLNASVGDAVSRRLSAASFDSGMSSNASIASLSAKAH